MKRWIFGIGIFLLMAACTLNATQEQALNRQTALYLKAINEHSALSVVSKTYPEYVKYAKAQGDDFFKAAFAKNIFTESPLVSTTIQQTKRKGKLIHVLFQASSYDYDNNSKRQFVAISENEGISWFFMPFKDYQDRKICKGLIRLV